MRHTAQDIVQQRIDQPGIAFQDLGPGQFRKAIRQALRLAGIRQLDEGITLLHETELSPGHLLGDIVVAVDIHLNRERSPGLQADVHQAEVVVQEVVIEDPLWHVSAFETRPTLGLNELERTATFHDAQDANQTGTDTLFVQLLLGPGILVNLSLLILENPALPLRIVLSVLDQPFGPSASDLVGKMATPDLEHMVDELLKFFATAEG
jgi:hypothetical protein